MNGDIRSAFGKMVRPVLAVAVLFPWVALAAERPADQGKQTPALAYRTPQGVTFSVTAEGLSEIRVGERVFAHGGWSVFNAEPWFKIGGSYAVDDATGVGLSPWKTGWQRTLLLWDYASWEADKREKLPQRRLIYFVVAPVPARGSRTFDLKLRVSPNRDWKHLLEPYREHFQQTFGPVRYKADHRWIATDFRNQVTPLLPVSNFQRADGIGKLQPRYLDSSGAWRQ